MTTTKATIVNRPGTRRRASGVQALSLAVRTGDVVDFIPLKAESDTPVAALAEARGRFPQYDISYPGATPTYVCTRCGSRVQSDEHEVTSRAVSGFLTTTQLQELWIRDISTLRLHSKCLVEIMAEAV